MIPQFQTRKEKNGNCIQAAVATLLDLPLSKVPDVALRAEQLMMDDWYAVDLLQKWLASVGLALIEIALPANMPWYPQLFPVLAIFFGETTAGIKHAIVGKLEGSEMVAIFNPWPEAEFAGGVSSIGLLVPLNPATYMNLGRAMAKVEKLSAGYDGVNRDPLSFSTEIKMDSIHKTATEVLNTGEPFTVLPNGDHP